MEPKLYVAVRDIATGRTFYQAIEYRNNETIGTAVDRYKNVMLGDAYAIDDAFIYNEN